MAARRLLIVMLILLGLSTLAAALVPQHNLRRETTAAVTTTHPAPTTTAAQPAGRSLLAPITVGGRKIVVVAGPVCKSAQKPRCAPIHVGDQLTVLVRSHFPTQLEIRQFGLISFATLQAPARFELLPTEPGTYGILYAPSDKVAARLEVLPAGGTAKQKQKARQKPAKSGARGGSGQS
jgi:hypothetical protein